MDTAEVIRVRPKLPEVGSLKWAELLVDLARNAAKYVASDCRPLASFVKELESGKAWEVWLKDEPKTKERFCDEALGVSKTVLQMWIKGIDLLESNGHKGRIPNTKAERTAKLAQRAKPIGDAIHAGTGRGNKTVDNVNGFTLGGNSSDYLIRRIARDRPDILKRMKAGEFRSVRAAGREAGIVKDRISISLEVESAARTIKKHFSRKQIKELIELL